MKLLKDIIFILLFASVIHAQGNDSLTIKYNFINSIPQNAEVYLNDSLIGFTPCRFLLAPTDSLISFRIKVKMAGYFDYLYSFVKADLPMNQTFYLLPTGKNNGSSDQIEKNNKSYFKTPRKIIPIAISAILAAGSGVSAYYFKNLADDRYNDYLNSGDPVLLDKTRKYDLISGISLVLFQVGLAGLIYFLLID